MTNQAANETKRQESSKNYKLTNTSNKSTTMKQSSRTYKSSKSIKKTIKQSKQTNKTNRRRQFTQQQRAGRTACKQFARRRISNSFPILALLNLAAPLPGREQTFQNSARSRARPAGTLTNHCEPATPWPALPATRRVIRVTGTTNERPPRPDGTLPSGTLKCDTPPGQPRCRRPVPSA